MLEEHEPASSRRWWNLGMTLHELAWIHAQRSELEQARALYEQARDAKQRAAPADREWDALSTTLHELGVVYATLGRAAEAIEAFNAALAANAQIASTDVRRNADAATLQALARVHLDVEAWAAAIDALSRALDVLDVLEEPARLARALYWRAYAHVELADFAAAESSAVAGLRVYSGIPDDTRPHEHHAELLHELAFLLRRRGDRTGAARHLCAARAAKRSEMT
jgi:tetratricopeptide (TPR) repeat protein